MVAFNNVIIASEYLISIWFLNSFWNVHFVITIYAFAHRQPSPHKILLSDWTSFKHKCKCVKYSNSVYKIERTIVNWNWQKKKKTTKKKKNHPRTFCASSSPRHHSGYWAKTVQKVEESRNDGRCKIDVITLVIIDNVSSVVPQEWQRYDKNECKQFHHRKMTKHTKANINRYEPSNSPYD